MPPVRKHIFTILISSGLLVLFAGCSDKNSQTNFDSATGKHVENWVADHQTTFLEKDENRVQCYECHGSDLHGGISQVSCFSASFDGISCHAAGPTPSSHSDPNWSDPSGHGAVAKTAPGIRTGFSYCQICHGANFTGGIVDISCFSCHMKAPHPDGVDWRDSNPPTHVNTNFDNAPICGICHQYGANSTRQPISPAPSGTPFGCFNNTLCHGREVSHPANYYTQHALDARISITGCALCHGSDYRGGNVGVSCYRCHLGGPNVNPNMMHPNLWSNPESSHQSYLENLNGNATGCSPTAPSGANVAQYCHGVNLLQISPRLVPPNGSWGLAPSCYSCHNKKWNQP